MRAEVRERGRVTRTRLADYARSWLARKRAALSVATLDRYAVALEDHILPTLGAWYVDAIAPDATTTARDGARRVLTALARGTSGVPVDGTRTRARRAKARQSDESKRTRAVAGARVSRKNESDAAFAGAVQQVRRARVEVSDGS